MFLQHLPLAIPPGVPPERDFARREQQFNFLVAASIEEINTFRARVRPGTTIIMRPRTNDSQASEPSESIIGIRLALALALAWS